MNKFRKILGRISAETLPKIDYFGSKSPKSPSAGGSTPRPLASGGWGLSPRPSFRLND